MTGWPTEEEVLQFAIYMAENRPGDAPRDEFGNLFIIGYNVPSQDELAEAESAQRQPCKQCKKNHPPWGRCSQNQKADKLMGNTLIVTNLSDEQIAGIASVLGLEGDSATEAPDAPAPEKAAKGKKDKKGKGKTEEVEADTADEATEEAVTYTAKALNKMERAELVSICEALGIEHKSKRVPTLVELILAKQKEVAAAGEADDDDFKAEDEADDWDEDVPPADDEAPKPKKAKGKGKDAKPAAKKGKKKK